MLGGGMYSIQLQSHSVQSQGEKSFTAIRRNDLGTQDCSLGLARPRQLWLPINPTNPIYIKQNSYA